MPAIFPLPDPRLTKVHSLEWAMIPPDESTGSADTPEGETTTQVDEKTPAQKTALIKDFETFIEQHIALVVLGNLKHEEGMRTLMNRMCGQITAPPTQRVLWITDEAQIATLEATIAKKVTEDLSSTIKYEDIQAFSSSPKVVRVIKKEKALKPAELVAHKIGFITIGLAFNEAVAQSTIPNLSTNS